MTPDPFRELTIPAFGGLRLDVDPQDVGWGGATALADVDLDTGGRFRTRPGREYVGADSATYAGNAQRIVRNLRAPSQQHTLTADGTQVICYDASGIHTAAVTTTTTGIVDLMSAGSSGTYVQDETGLRLYNPGTHTLGAAVVGSPKSGYLGYEARSSRIVVAAGSTAGVNKDRVHFSDPGLTSFTSTNWVDIEPGPEQITGVSELGELVVVFKESRAYVFTGESTLSDGSPQFLYRPVNLGDKIAPPVGGVGSFGGRFSSDGQAIYYVASRGVYRWAGGTPELISPQLTPVWRDEFSTASGARAVSTFTLATADRVYVGGISNYTFVFEKATGQWTAYGFTCRSMAGGEQSREVYLGAADPSLGTQRLQHMAASLTDDFGTAIAWSYTSGYTAPANGQRVKLRGSSLWGYATNPVTLQILTQGGRTNDVVDPGGAVTLGAVTVGEGKRRRSTRGVLFAHKLSGTGPATISRLTHRFLQPEPSY